MKIKTNIKAVGCTANYNQTLVREAKKNLRVKSSVKAGIKL
jgi:hypothetical protein